MSKLKIEKRGKGEYWVENPDDTKEIWCGPYKNKTEAIEARDGLHRTMETKTWKIIQTEWANKAKIEINEKTDEPVQSKSLLSGLGGLFPPMG